MIAEAAFAAWSSGKLPLDRRWPPSVADSLWGVGARSLVAPRRSVRKRSKLSQPGEVRCRRAIEARIWRSAKLYDEKRHDAERMSTSHAG